MVIGECSVDCLLLLMPGLDWQLATGNWQLATGNRLRGSSRRSNVLLSSWHCETSSCLDRTNSCLRCDRGRHYSVLTGYQKRTMFE
jgi:hypothetical protein